MKALKNTQLWGFFRWEGMGMFRVMVNPQLWKKNVGANCIQNLLPFNNKPTIALIKIYLNIYILYPYNHLE